MNIVVLSPGYTLEPLGGSFEKSWCSAYTPDQFNQNLSDGVLGIVYGDFLSDSKVKPRLRTSA